MPNENKNIRTKVKYFLYVLNLKYIHIQTIILYYIFIYIADILLYNKINSFINLWFARGRPSDPAIR